MEFEEVLLNDCLEIIIDYRGKTPKKLGGDWDENGDYRAISAKNIKNNKLVNVDAVKRIDTEIYTKWMKEEVKKGDVLLTSEAPLGETVFWDSNEKIVLSQRVFGLRAKKNILYPKYLWAFMQSRFFKHEITSRESGTTVTGIRRSELEKVKIKLPKYQAQKYIGDLFYNISTKIKVNEEIQVSIQRISQTLFKHWFIDFEFPNEQGQPYRSSGGEMVESELGMIPKGWQVSHIGELIMDTIGGDWGKETPQGNHTEEVSIIRGADIPEIKLGRDGKVPIRFILTKNYNNKKLCHGDVMIEISGGSPTQSTGRAAFINKKIIRKYNNKVLCTNFCRVLRPTRKEYGLFVYLLISYLYEKDVFFNFENGTTGIKNLDLKAILNKYKVVLPSRELITLFNKRISMFDSSIHEMGNENKKLEELRDTLLPKLLSGEIEIPDEMEVK